ncbi:hypothetical protein Dacet_2553 [Denitrovibrio acetiphilus DSM 12809]|jgi:hypothetical protein|uniref:Nicotinamide mononucleotide transporter PnuC n=1 Tax=Denitrovibrio acetiphilus (strain DSM 12809 / NBRC 114555 / N2460) TaxID=522772 RepID=D4H4I3_DENA2|nr:hypothetical protein [Denitrovibrio acetiphilus]ADD69312.1 hypothetical protein Dacet_2553 [Denitrovibrio acetiphilus DSM 12809]
MAEIIAQTGIFIFGGLSIWLVGRTESWRKWGFLAGLISQPFFLYTAYQHKQIGLFLIGLWYTYSWVQGVYNYIYTPYKLNKQKAGNNE